MTSANGRQTGFSPQLPFEGLTTYGSVTLLRTKGAEEMPDSVDFASLKILVIDDQEFVRTIVKKMLQQLGVATVIEAHDGDSGLDMVRREKPQMVICDIQMRPMDGFSFVTALRRETDLRDTPVVMLTAHTDKATQAQAQDMRVDALLVKPVFPQGLLECIIKVLGTPPSAT